jgi:peptidyl-prolyl cis-trans isomerase C
MKQPLIATVGFIILFLLANVANASATDDPVLFRWADQQLTQSDFDGAMARIPAEHRTLFLSDMKRIMDTLVAMMLNRSLALEAKNSDLLDREPTIRKHLQLEAEKILAGYRIGDFVAKLKIPDLAAAAEDYYATHPTEFITSGKIRASHVLVDIKKYGEARARQRADEVRTKALAGYDFAELARQYSDDPSVTKNSGDLGLFAKGAMTKPFEDAAYALTAPGQISGIVTTEFGYHIIRLTQGAQQRKQDFAEVKDSLVTRLKEQYIERERTAYTQRITSNPTLVVNDAVIRGLLHSIPSSKAGN